MTKKYKNKEKGFTLIELMVATSIFSMVMLASLGALFTLLGASKNSRATHTAMDNVNFALESMTRSIRMGSKYYCTKVGDTPPTNFVNGNNCSGGGTAISFFPQGEKKTPTTYMLVNGTIKKYIGEEDNGVQVISDAVNVEDLRFYVTGAEEPYKQPSVFIRLKGVVRVKEKRIPFLIQTFINQRNY